MLRLDNGNMMGTDWTVANKTYVACRLSLGHAVGDHKDHKRS